MVDSRAGRPSASKIIILGCALALALAACGKKAPPVAPQNEPLAAVDDLKGEVVHETVRLSWHHDPENRSAVEYLVLRAQVPLDQPECPGCPMVIQKVGSVRMSRALRHERHVLDFSQKLMTGFRYTFYVRAVNSSGVQGPDSNPVVVQIPRPDIK